MTKIPFDVIPLESNRANNWMCWVNGLMIFLAIFFVAGSLMFQSVIVFWQEKNQHGFTIEIPPPDSPQAMASEILTQQKIFELLKQTPGIRNYHVVTKSTIYSTTDIFHSEQHSQTPTPIVIDVEIHPTMSVDLEKLQHLLIEIAPGAEIMKTREWQQGLMKIAEVIFTLGLVLTSVVCLITLIIVIFSTHTGLAIHQKIVNTLIQLGATRTFIATRFQKHAIHSTLLSSLIGAVIAFLTCIVVLTLLLQNSWSSIISAFPIGKVLLAMLGIPLCLIVLAIIVSHITVYIGIKRQGLC